MKNAAPTTPVTSVTSVTSVTPVTPVSMPLRDGAGHLRAGVAAGVDARSRRARGQPDHERAFLDGARSNDALAEQLGESFVAAATGGEDPGEELLGRLDAGDSGGPFLETSSSVEFAGGTDASNPKDATREPFPRT